MGPYNIIIFIESLRIIEMSNRNRDSSEITRQRLLKTIVTNIQIQKQNLINGIGLRVRYQGGSGSSRDASNVTKIQGIFIEDEKPRVKRKAPPEFLAPAPSPSPAPAPAAAAAASTAPAPESSEAPQSPEALPPAPEALPPAPEAPESTEVPQSEVPQSELPQSEVPQSPFTQPQLQTLKILILGDLNIGKISESIKKGLGLQYRIKIVSRVLGKTYSGSEIGPDTNIVIIWKTEDHQGSPELTENLNKYIENGGNLITQHTDPEILIKSICALNPRLDKIY